MDLTPARKKYIIDRIAALEKQKVDIQVRADREIANKNKEIQKLEEELVRG